MLPAAHRLRRTREFSGTVSAGRRTGRRHLVVYLRVPSRDAGDLSDSREALGSDGAPAKVGVIVSRAVGGSVQRNAVKRRLRHVISGQMDRLPQGSFLVIRALPAAAGASSRALTSDVSGALDRLIGQAA